MRSINHYGKIIGHLLMIYPPTHMLELGIRETEVSFLRSDMPFYSYLHYNEMILSSLQTTEEPKPQKYISAFNG